MRRLVVMSIAVFAQCVAFGQAPSLQPAFEVASVKTAGPPREEPGGARSTGMPPRTFGDPGLVNYSSVTLKGVLCRAYNLLPDKIVGPSWLDSERYDIVAKVPKGAPPGQIPSMLQNLLAERFRMSVHWETKQTPGYALVVGKSGPKLTKSALEDATRRSFGFNGSGHLAWKGETLADVATVLSTFLDRPVVDMTEIPGIFDITLDAAPDSLPGLHFGAPSEDSASFPSIFAAIRGLGLNLEPREVPVKQLVVDSAQKIPTPN
ncbi:MAG TPA: TIGR03435 family protein [Verrucomicrobiae bacterium]